MKFLLLVLVFLFLLPTRAFAITNPLAVENNHFGIHILEENDLEDAAHLLNSNGGDWGYVTLVIRQDEMDFTKWQNTFDLMRRLHLIPILRIATTQSVNSWDAPKPEDSQYWAEFLNSLNWVVKNRYVVLFNEPNHAKEWGGKISPVEYAEVVNQFSKALKAKSPDFFILSAGMDLSAPNSASTMDAFNFYQRMHAADPGVFENFDGLASHSYPNPGFAGSVEDSGRKSISGFLDEVNYLRQFGVDANIPIFVTETGWVNDQNLDIEDNYTKAFIGPWKRPNIVAVTPFILNYAQPPFEQFSFKKATGEYNPWYQAITRLPKTAGKPIQLDSMEIIDAQLPDSLILDSNYLLPMKIKNTGQKIWIPGEKNVVGVDGVPYTQPGEAAQFYVELETPIEGSSIEVDLGFVSKEIKLVPPTTLTLHVATAFQLKQTFTVDLLMYDADRLLKKIENVLISDSKAEVGNIHDVIPGKTYRFVVIKPFYLPVQAYQLIDSKDTQIIFPLLIPVDFDADGDLNITDLLALLTHPGESINRLLPFVLF